MHTHTAFYGRRRQKVEPLPGWHRLPPVPRPRLPLPPVPRPRLPCRRSPGPGFPSAAGLPRGPGFSRPRLLPAPVPLQTRLAAAPAPPAAGFPGDGPRFPPPRRHPQTRLAAAGSPRPPVSPDPASVPRPRPHPKPRSPQAPLAPAPAPPPPASPAPASPQAPLAPAPTAPPPASPDPAPASPGPGLTPAPASPRPRSPQPRLPRRRFPRGGRESFGPTSASARAPAGPRGGPDLHHEALTCDVSEGVSPAPGPGHAHRGPLEHRRGGDGMMPARSRSAGPGSR
ncbi:hypothetical protein SAMN04489732_102582 [Amycolatopsis saalfeldensis]|uniref:Uncharacterized protein n=1 Tax=Amycolatopsis saalfeldensis TaxID=394193 RepID=A0A1H8TEV4_9PSEU|nr:hypothetical protein SAMN04489732_102582 [Amycolatopsis saalfeldensis]